MMKYTVTIINEEGRHITHDDLTYEQVVELVETLNDVTTLLITTEVRR